MAHCDVIIIFDCCNAAAVLGDDYTIERRCEVLCAAGVVEKPSPIYSFTSALTALLNTDEALNGMTVNQIGRRISSTEFVKRYKLETTPMPRNLTTNRELRDSILLHPLGERRVRARPNQATTVQKSVDASNESEARVVIVVRFQDPSATPFTEEWLRWVRGRPANINDIDIVLKSKEQLELIAQVQTDLNTSPQEPLRIPSPTAKTPELVGHAPESTAAAARRKNISFLVEGEKHGPSRAAQISKAPVEAQKLHHHSSLESPPSGDRTRGSRWRKLRSFMPRLTTAKNSVTPDDMLSISKRRLAKFGCGADLGSNFSRLFLFLLLCQ
ncbi:hypothetical protein F4779DRAFT_61466 [Xylariaceae sp. FL0662B]|nr:hypothetical protein F4779DRAFT_61466 [Xylariaceae sp. FL0662B]